MYWLGVACLRGLVVSFALLVGLKFVLCLLYFAVVLMFRWLLSFACGLFVGCCRLVYLGCCVL